VALIIEVIEGNMAGRQSLMTRIGTLSMPGALFEAIDFTMDSTWLDYKGLQRIQNTTSDDTNRKNTICYSQCCMLTNINCPRRVLAQRPKPEEASL